MPVLDPTLLMALKIRSAKISSPYYVRQPHKPGLRAYSCFEQKPKESGLRGYLFFEPKAHDEKEVLEFEIFKKKMAHLVECTPEPQFGINLRYYACSNNIAQRTLKWLDENGFQAEISMVHDEGGDIPWLIILSIPNVRSHRNLSSMPEMTTCSI
jgi:hypothetical protein